MRPAAHYPGRRAFEAALAYLREGWPEFCEGVEFALCAPAAWPPDAPPGSVAVFMPPALVAVRAVRAPAAFYVASLVHELQHRRQWAASGQGATWSASPGEEFEAEAAGRRVAAWYPRARP